MLPDVDKIEVKQKYGQLKLLLMLVVTVTCDVPMASQATILVTELLERPNVY